MFAVILFLKILLTLLIIFISVLILVIIIPYSYNIKYNINSAIFGHVRIKAFGGLIQFEHEKLQDESKLKIYIFRFLIYCKCNDEKIEKEEVYKNKKHRINFKWIKRKLIERVIQYLYEVGGLLKPKSFTISGVYGSDDPVVTGVISAVIPIIQVVIPSVNIDLNPIFLEDTIDIKIEGLGRVSLLVIGFKTVVFVLDKNIRTIIFKGVDS
jgi:hypothetical protein